jgi:hypothetical protein
VKAAPKTGGRQGDRLDNLDVEHKMYFAYLALLYTKNQGQKKLGANFEHFWLVVGMLFSPKLLINARTLMSGY